MCIRRFAFVLALTLGALSGCAPRYRWVNELDVPGACRGVDSRRSLAERVEPGAPAGAAGVRGRVERQDGAPVEQAAVVLRRAAGTPPVVAYADVDGAFAASNIPPGTYRLEVRRLGYAMVRDTLTVTSQREVRLRVRMAEQPLDGPCSGFAMVQVRQPWWHFW